MKQVICALAIAALLISCEKQKGQLEKFVFDNKQIATRTVHEYVLDRESRIKMDRSTTFQYMAGIPFDTTVTETYFEYNEKGLLTSSLSLPDSSRQIKLYNELDSLTADYHINFAGDTSDMALTIYENGKVVRRVNRHLSMKLPEDLENIKREDLRNYDTALWVTDLLYEEDTHVKSLLREINEITGEIEHYYEGKKQVKSIEYALLGDLRYMKQTTYSVARDDNEPDFFSIDVAGDTVSWTKTIMLEDGKAVVSYLREIDMQNTFYYNTLGQLTSVASSDLKALEKTVDLYKYDARGNKVEEVSYRVKINLDSDQ